MAFVSVALADGAGAGFIVELSVWGSRVRSVRIKLDYSMSLCRVFVRHDNKKSDAYATDARFKLFLLSRKLIREDNFSTWGR